MTHRRTFGVLEIARRHPRLFSMLTRYRAACVEAERRAAA
jgi:hypothetical protein